MKKGYLLVVITLVLILVFQVILRIPFFYEPLEGDEGVYAYMAQLLLQGKVPYRDAFDHKPPGVYFIYAVIFKVFGESLLSLRLATTFYSLLTTLSIFLVAQLILGGAGGLWASLFYAIFSGGPFVEGTSSNTESFMVLPLVLALFMFCKWLKDRQSWLIFGAGLFSGLAVMFKQVAVFNFLALVGFTIFKKEDRKRLSFWQVGYGPELWLLLLGFLVVPAFFTFYFLIKGAINDYFLYSFLFNLGYVQTRLSLFGLFKTFYIAGVENSVLWFLAFVGFYWILKEDRTLQNLLLLSWGLLSFVGVYWGGFFFGHYYIQLIPFLSLLSAYGAIKWYEKRSVIKASVNLMGLIIMFLLFLMILQNQWEFYFKYSPDEISFYKYGHFFNVRAKEVAEVLNKVASQEDYILVRGFPQIHFYTKLKSPCKYFYGFPEFYGSNSICFFGKKIYNEEYCFRISPRFTQEKKVDFIRGLNDKYTRFIVLFRFLDDLHQKEYKFKNYGFKRVYIDNDLVIYERKRL